MYIYTLDGIQQMIYCIRHGHIYKLVKVQPVNVNNDTRLKSVFNLNY